MKKQYVVWLSFVGLMTSGSLMAAPLHESQRAIWNHAPALNDWLKAVLKV